MVFHPLLSLIVYFLLPSSIISPFLISPTSDPGTLVGSQRLQQIINPADPLEIQADVHWTHIREKEEEERMVPTSESSTSRGNCFKIQGPNAPQSTFPSHCCRGLFCQDQSLQFDKNVRANEPFYFPDVNCDHYP